ncbi:hypothetical protein BCIN_14g02380 [Botrytis cinerea B05.10]|uniref:Uncharacterized protein n=3 Tax=Botryotinia fuckeliana TaxID=40559 RepID=A0A384K3D4_BOTFB|nr:hypothetical protein BCIN_14g02380 [Botrytis cinerea B05.10]ATZ57057.1 hypothetical protein BCIN_14g02380 [Botrytis cinerea B05.10]EMR84727.1 putative major facilitator superfamily protein [Botrytis cinerea BcDW1]CCD44254.1 hypothetical protein BofuT4_P058340.1 [Botrytis cinerea T4]
MSSTASIPRFLLPLRSPLWSVSSKTTKTTIRNASTKSKNNASKKSPKPLVLEKPTKFNPPSHPARLRKDPPRYPGPQLSAEEIARQSVKKYPNMMPPEGTFMHWFLNNKSIHIWIALGTLSTLAGGVWITNFKRDSPFGDMLPEWPQLFLHPIAFTRTCYEVLQLHTAHVTAETMERRKHKVEDVAKRAAYRKAHGLDKDESFGGWTAKTDKEVLGPGIKLGHEKEAEIAETAEGGVGKGKEAEKQVVYEKQFSGKKWLGIW